MVIVFNCVWNCQIPPMLHHLIFPSAVCEGSNFPTSSQHLLISVVLILTILVGAKWYFVVVFVSFRLFFRCFLSIHALLPSMFAACIQMLIGLNWRCYKSCWFCCFSCFISASVQQVPVMDVHSISCGRVLKLALCAQSMTSMRLRVPVRGDFR